MSLDAPAWMRPGDVAEVVGIREVDTAEVAAQFAAQMGANIYLIEFGDGTALEVAATWVSPQTQ